MRILESGGTIEQHKAAIAAATAAAAAMKYDVSACSTTEEEPHINAAFLTSRYIPNHFTKTYGFYV